MTPDSYRQNHAYTIIKTLHRSRLYIVYLAKHQISKEYVVLKTIDSHFASDPRLNEQLQDEARLLFKLNSPYIRKCRGSFTESGKSYLVFDYIEGKSLAEILENVSISIAIDMVLQWLDGILDGISTAHNLGIYHCNLNPSNILINQDGKPYLIGFGKPEQYWMNADPNQAGIHPLMYVAPELFLAAQPGAAADIYSIGTLAYLMLCGRLPWAIDNRHSIQTQKQASLQKPVLDPEFIGRNVPRWLYSIIHKCLRIEPERRFLSAAQLKEALIAKQEIRIEPIQVEADYIWDKEPEPEPELEPVPEPEPEPIPVPDPEPEPEPQPEPEPIPIQPKPEPVRIPEPPKAEPRPEPAPVKEPSATSEYTAPPPKRAPIVPPPKKEPPVQPITIEAEEMLNPNVKKWGLIMGIASLLVILFAVLKYTVFDKTFQPATGQEPQKTDTEQIARYVPNKPIDMIYVKADSVVIGSVSADAKDNEFPPLKLYVPSFWISPYEITNQEWSMVYKEHQYPEERAHLPVTNISFLDVLEYCNEKSFLDKLTPCYDIQGGYICDFAANGYRLPTEAEWEYAAKGHSSDDYFAYSGSDDPDRAGWFNENSDGRLKPVGQKNPNELGLYDMSGNAYEWVWNWYGRYSSAGNPFEGPATGTDKVIRGGSSNHDAYAMRVSSRSHTKQFAKNPFVGFRLVRSAGK